MTAGLLELLWATTAESCKRGNIGRFSNEDIAMAVEFDGDADKFVEALVETGWLDEDDEFRLVVHDWAEHCPNYIKGNIAHKGGFCRPKAGPKDNPKGEPKANPKDGPREGRKDDPGDGPRDHPTQPSLAKSSQAKSNQVQPNHNAAAAKAAAASEFQGKLTKALEDPAQADSFRRLAAHLEKSSGRSLPSEYIWSVAVVSELLLGGFVGETVTRLRNREIEKPRQYIDRVMRDECGERSLDWRAMQDLVRDETLRLAELRRSQPGNTDDRDAELEDNHQPQTLTVEGNQ